MEFAKQWVSEHESIQSRKASESSKPRSGFNDCFNEIELGPIDDGILEDRMAALTIDNSLGFSDYRLDYYNHITAEERCTWKRPDAKEISCASEDFIFQHTDTTQTIDTMTEMPIIRLTGITAEGNSVMLSICSSRPYFYMDVQDPQEANVLMQNLEQMLRRDVKGRSRVKGRYVLSMEPVMKRNMCGWHKDEPCGVMYKVTMCYPGHIKKARDSLEYANRAVTERKIQTFEANVPFELRYMVDTKLAGCQWIKLVGGTYSRVIDPKNAPYQARDSPSNVQYHLYMTNGYDHNAIQPLDVKDYGDLAPLRVLSFDIEAKRKGAGFVDASVDPVICICSSLYLVGTGTIHRACFAYVPPGSSVAPIPEVDLLLVYESEELMMLAFTQYINESDPDIFTGWNITGFDWPYLGKRARALGIWHAFMLITRIQGQTAFMRERVFQSKAYGAKKSNELVCEGRFEYDGLVYLLRMVYRKFRSYGLNAISGEILKDSKVDVDYSQIPILHEGTDEDRAHLCMYCSKDAQLPLDILEKMMAFVNGIEQSRVTGVPLKWLLTRGQGIKTFSNILRYKLDNEAVPSRSPKLNNVYTVGGYVRDPIAGYYDWPIATLDFASLYPSIMQAYNICYSTVISLSEAQMRLKPEDYNVPPIPGADFCFVKDHVRRGVLPDMLTALLGQRRYVKGLLKTAEKGSLLYGVLDGRQLALKVVCNSVYGFLKAFILIDPRLMTSVTSWGQEMIKETARLCEEEFQGRWIVDRKACLQKGIDFEKEPAPGEIDPRPMRQYNARIIYGDTDSVMVDFGDTTLKQIVEFGDEAARICTQTFVAPNKLEFESVKLRALFMRKKRYGSLELEGATADMTIAQAMAKAKIVPKGLESKRRDNAKIGSETQTKVLELILRHGDVAGAQRVVEDAIRQLLNDEVDMSKLIITKGLSKTDEQYEQGGTKQQHTELKKRIAARSHITGEVVPQTGDRVPFVMTAGATGAKSCELAEHPVYAQRNKVPIDKTYYIEKQIMAATLRLFTCVWEPSKILEIQSSMTHKKLRQLEAYKRLFKPDLPHMRKKKLAVASENTPMGRFLLSNSTLTTYVTCAYPACQIRVLNNNSNGVCKEHSAAEAEYLLKIEEEKRIQARNEAWDKCRKCAGISFDEHTCSNMTCSNFFHRQTVITDLEDLGKVLERLTVSPTKAVKQTSGNKKRDRIQVEIEEEKEERDLKQHPPKKAASTITDFFSKKT